MEQVNTQAALQAATDAVKQAWGYPPARMVVGIDLAKELFEVVRPLTKTTQSEFLAAIERGEVEFNKMKLEAGWL